MPLRWSTNFVNSGQNVQQVSLEALQTYMVQQEAQNDAHQKRPVILTRRRNQKHLSIKTDKVNTIRNHPILILRQKIKRNKSHERYATMMTAPFMAAATNGGSVIRISTARTSVLAVLHRPITLTAAISLHETYLKDRIITKDLPAKFKYIQTNAATLTTVTTEANRATIALHLRLVTPLLTIPMQTMQINIVIKCQ